MRKGLTGLGVPIVRKERADSVQGIHTMLNIRCLRWSVRENDGEFSNEVCSLRYENKDELEKPPLFGAMFHFTLDSQVNCPEFLAYFPLVKQ